MSKVILVDMDGVLADLEAGLEVFLRKENPWSFVIPFTKRSVFLSTEEYPEAERHRVLRALRSPGFFENLLPMPGAVAGLCALSSRAEIWICTAPMNGSATCATEKFRWVERHLGPDWTDRIIVTRDKTMVHGNYLIDDRPIITGSRQPSWEHVVFAAPYNEGRSPRVLWHDVAKGAIENHPHHDLQRVVTHCAAFGIGLRFSYQGEARYVRHPRLHRVSPHEWALRAYCQKRFLDLPFHVPDITDFEFHEQD